jgi:hypothetical protein
MVLQKWGKNFHCEGDDGTLTYIESVGGCRRFVKEVDEGADFKADLPTLDAGAIGVRTVSFTVHEIRRKPENDLTPVMHEVDGVRKPEKKYTDADFKIIVKAYEEWQKRCEDDADENEDDLEIDRLDKQEVTELRTELKTAMAELAAQRREAMRKQELADDLKRKLEEQKDGDKDNGMARTVLGKAPVFSKKLPAKTNQEAFKAWFEALGRHKHLSLEDIKFFLVGSGLPNFVRKEPITANALAKAIDVYCVRGQATAMDDAMENFDKHRSIADHQDPESFINSLQDCYGDFADCEYGCEMPDKLKGWFGLKKAKLDKAQRAVVLGAIKNLGGMTWNNFKNALLDTCSNGTQAEDEHKLLYANTKGAPGGKQSGKWCDICSNSSHWTSSCRFNLKTKGDNGGKDKGKKGKGKGQRNYENPGGKGDSGKKNK